MCGYKGRWGIDPRAWNNFLLKLLHLIYHLPRWDKKRKRKKKIIKFSIIIGVELSANTLRIGIWDLPFGYFSKYRPIQSNIILIPRFKTLIIIVVFMENPYEGKLFLVLLEDPCEGKLFLVMGESALIWTNLRYFYLVRSDPSWNETNFPNTRTNPI